MSKADKRLRNPVNGTINKPTTIFSSKANSESKARVAKNKTTNAYLAAEKETASQQFIMGCGAKPQPFCDVCIYG